MLARLFAALIWTLVGALPLFAQAVTDSVQPPTGAVQLRHFDEERLEALRADPDLQYELSVVRRPSLWERFKAWLGELFERLLGTQAGSWVTEHLLYLFVLTMLIFALVLLYRGGLRRVFHGAPRSAAAVHVAEEDIRGLDLEAMIAEAEAAGELRRAIRLQYLLVLRRLVDAGVLHWAPDHTDGHYAAQITDPDLRRRFKRAARVFQWVWYGHAEVSPGRYELLRRPFVNEPWPQQA